MSELEGIDATAVQREHVAGDRLVEHPRTPPTQQVDGGPGERRPVAEVSVSEVVVDEQQQLPVNLLVKPVVTRQYVQDLPACERPEGDPPIDAGAQHGLTRQHLPAAVA